MPTGLLKDIVGARPRTGRLMGLDVGQKTIGLALSSPDFTYATPLTTIRRVKFTQDMVTLAKFVQDYEVTGFIAGYPINMDGSTGPRCQSIRDFVAEMMRIPDVVGTAPWVALWDERLSTATVENFVDNIVEKRKTRINAKSSGLIDKLAAQSILQGALDFIAREK